MTTGKVKVAIDASPLSGGHAVRGIGYFTRQFIDAILSQQKNHPDFGQWQIDLVESKNGFDPQKYDLIHYPSFDIFAPTLPSRLPTPYIVTVHDLIPIEYKEHFPAGFRGQINWQLQKHRLLKSRLVITISHYSKFVINDLTKYPIDQIYVTYGAADQNFQPVTNQATLKQIRSKYHLPPKFVMYLGDVNWNKNLPSLVSTCLDQKIPLVIVGAAAVRQQVDNHPWNRDLLWLQQTAASPSGQRLITLTGFVPDSDLPGFFSLATLYCQPSYAEGFGLPIVQAMQCGCPVVASNQTCLPEIAYHSALLFNPYSPSNLASTVRQMFTRPALRQKYINLGLLRSRHFNWQNTGLQTLAVYQQALFYGKK